MTTAEFVALLLGVLSALYVLITKLVSYITNKSDKELEIVKNLLKEVSVNIGGLTTKTEVTLEKMSSNVEHIKDIKENLKGFRQDLTQAQLDIRQLKREVEALKKYKNIRQYEDN